MTNEEAKEKAFLINGLALGLPLDFCQTVYSFLLSAVITSRGFYQIFENVYSKDDVSKYLYEMIQEGLIIISENENGIFDENSFLDINETYLKSYIKFNGESL